MTNFRFAVLTVGFVFAGNVPARADDAADARALVEKAVKAPGQVRKGYPGATHPKVILRSPAPKNRCDVSESDIATTARRTGDEPLPG